MREKQELSWINMNLRIVQVELKIGISHHLKGHSFRAEEKFRGELDANYR